MKMGRKPSLDVLIYSGKTIYSDDKICLIIIRFIGIKDGVLYE